MEETESLAGSQLMGPAGASGGGPGIIYCFSSYSSAIMASFIVLFRDITITNKKNCCQKMCKRKITRSLGNIAL